MTDPSPAAIGAKTILRDSLGLSQGTDLLLLLDETALSVLDPFWEAARELGVNLSTLFYSRLQQLHLSEMSRLDRNALASAEAAILAHTADDACSSFRTKLVSEWRGTTRLATMPGANAQILEIASRSDYEQMAKRCEALTPPLLNGRECVLTTYAPSGEAFRLRFTLGGLDRIPVHSIGILRESAWGNVPSGEIFTAPLEDSANGDYLVNGTIGRQVLGDEPAVLTFRHGRLIGHRYLTSGEPVPYLLEIERFSAEREDHNWNVIAEFGIGVNEGINAVLGIPLIDEKIFGTVHIAVGNNVGWQGSNKALLHLDIITREPDVEIDGVNVLLRGRHKFDASAFDDLATYHPVPGRLWPRDSTSARVNTKGFSLAEGRLMIHLHQTQSGRRTLFPLANARTTSAARRLLKSARGQVLDTTRTPGDLDLHTQEEVQALLSLLWSYGAIEPATD
ncbi:MAG TPA: hypothetical protein VF017_23545 [Thermoanaerobaculia bacterium]|nr:hypothetical protein [Thermoanaerobaculia bacterium]